MTDVVTFHFAADGAIRTIYSDLFADAYPEIGSTTIRRASHVEPTPEGASWTADLRPVDGPILGPFPTRAAALAAELVWLDANLSQLS